MTKQIFVFLLLCIMATPLWSQSGITKPKPNLETMTVEQQFDYLINDSERFKEFQMVNRRSLRKVKGYVMDTLKNVRVELKNTQDLVATQKKEIEDLKAELGNTNDNLTKVSDEKNSISIFGQNISKGAYNGIMWSIIGGLLAFLLLYIFRFNRSHGIIKKTQETLDRTRNDFEGFRERMLKKEQELARKLQDELNRNAGS